MTLLLGPGPQPVALLPARAESLARRFSQRLRQLSLFEDQRITLGGAIDLSLASLSAYGQDYKHWVISYSGGKDSTAVCVFVLWALETGQVQRPETLTVVYADTRQELPPLHLLALGFLDRMRRHGVRVHVVLPPMEHRFYVYILGRGVMPPKNHMRWCTDKLKIRPIESYYAELRQETGEKFLQLTGVRLGESAQRDARIQLSCNSDDGECGQGWFQARPSEHVADSLAPLVHWRACYVWDWLMWCHDDRDINELAGYTKGHGFRDLVELAILYGQSEGRTGCIGCPLVSEDTALKNMIALPQYAHFSPLMEVRGVIEEMRLPQHRLRQVEPERIEGGFSKSGQRMGPLTMEARAHFLARILDIQQRAGIDLINAEEEAVIRQMWADNVWPQKWTGEEPLATVPFVSISSDGTNLFIQPRLEGIA